MASMRWGELMRRNAKSIVSLATVTLAAVLASGLAVTDSRSESVSSTTVVSVYFLDAAGKPAPLESIPRELTIHLGAMPGRFGGVGDVPLQAIRVGRNKEFQLNLSGLSAKLGAGAAQLDRSDTSPLELTPNDVKFSRVSTGVASGTEPMRGLAVVFWDLKANGSLVPVYFDRPCQIRPLLLANSIPIDIPSSGLAWMLTTRDEDSRYVLTLAVNPRPAIIIAPPEALDKISTSTLVSLNQ